MKTLLQTQALRSAPSDLVHRFRELDPTLDLVYIGAGQWLLGSVQPHAERAMRARRMMARQEEMPVERRRAGVYLWARMLEQGIRPIALYSEAEIHDGRAMLDFRERDWRWRNQAEEAFRASADRVDRGVDVEKRIITILDAVHGASSDLHAHVFRKRQVVRQPGLPWSH